MISAHKFVVLLVLGLARCLSAGDFSITCYVSPNGSSGNPGTEARPWSLSKANFGLRAGDTAILMDGVYSVGISPINSGTAEHPITFRAQHSCRASITNASPAIGVSDRSHIVIEGIKVENAGSSRWVEGNNSHHITIKDCYFRNSESWESCRFRNTDGYITVTGCHLEDGQDSLHVSGGRGHYIAGNTFIKDAHTNLVILGVSNSVIENNVLKNDVRRCMEVFSKRGVFTPPAKSEYNVIQNNYFYSANWEGIQYAGSLSIIRNNVFDGGTTGMKWTIQYGGPGDAPEAWWCEKNRFYNNTLYGCEIAIQAGASYILMEQHGGAFGDNVHVNNIICAPSSQQATRIDLEPTRMPLYYNNILTDKSGQRVLRELAAKYPHHLGNNIEVSPQFVDPASDDFHLQVQSECIDAGGPLTYTKGGGSGKKIVVDDALFFTDGYGLVAPDVIRVGDDTCTIADVNYDTRTITVEEPITWTDADSVWMNYCGGGPDMGAYEFRGSSNSVTTGNVSEKQQ